MDNERCGTCRYWRKATRLGQSNKWLGHCRIEEPDEAGYPIMKENEWCSDYKDQSNEG